MVVVGVVCGHLLDAGGDAPHWLDAWLQGCPAPRPPPPALLSPRGSRAPPCLSPGAYVALLPLALGSLPNPQASVPLSMSRVPSSVTCPLARTTGARILPASVPMSLAAPPSADHTPLRPMRSVAARLGPLLVSLRFLPVPLPLSCSVSRVMLPAARALPPSAATGLGALPAPSPSLLAACAQACPLRSSLRTPPVAFSPPLRAPVAGTLPRLRAVPPLPDHAPGVLLPPQLRRQQDARQRMHGRRGGRTGRGLPSGRRPWGGTGLGGLVWVWLGLVLARYFAPSLPPSAAALAPGQALGARAGATPCASGVPGAAAWSVGAKARPAGAAVSDPCAPGAPSGGGAAGFAAWAAGSASSVGAGSWVDG